MGNDYLRLASTFHGLHTISAEVAPLISAGIDMLDADTFRLQCLHTLTGNCQTCGESRNGVWRGGRGRGYTYADSVVRPSEGSGSL